MRDRKRDTNGIFAQMYKKQFENEAVIKLIQTEVMNLFFLFCSKI